MALSHKKAIFHLKVNHYTVSITYTSHTQKITIKIYNTLSNLSNHTKMAISCLVCNI